MTEPTRPWTRPTLVVLVKSGPAEVVLSILMPLKSVAEAIRSISDRMAENSSFMIDRWESL